MNKISSLIIFVLLMSSCSMQKRLYTKGFYASKHQAAKKTICDKDTLPSVAVNHIKTKSKNENAVAANSKFITLNSKLISGCDTIVLRSGARIVANVSEINQSQIKFKNCGATNEADVVISKSDVNYILLANGSRESFAATVDENKYNPQNVSQDQGYDKSKNHYDSRKVNRHESQGSKKQNGFSTAGFVMALISHPVAGIVALIGAIYTIFPSSNGVFPLNILLIPFFIAAIAFVFCVVAIYQISTNPESQKGLTIAIIGAFLSLLLMVLLLLIYLQILI